MYLSEGLGHAFVSLADDSSVTYLVSTGYSPGREFGDRTRWTPSWTCPGRPTWSSSCPPRTRPRPTLAEAREQGLLPTMEQCAARYAELRPGGQLTVRTPSSRRQARSECSQSGRAGSPAAVQPAPSSTE